MNEISKFQMVVGFALLALAGVTCYFSIPTGVVLFGIAAYGINDARN